MPKTEFHNVPYRKWVKGALAITKEGKRVFDLAMRSHQDGKAVTMRQSQPMSAGFTETGSPIRRSDGLYDTISVTIED